MSQNSPADKERTSTSKVLTRGIEGKVLLLGITACVTQIRKYVNLPLQLSKQTNKQTNKACLPGPSGYMNLTSMIKQTDSTLP